MASKNTGKKGKHVIKQHEKEEIQNVGEVQVRVPRGDRDWDGHHVFMVAAYDGYCYLINKETGEIYWRVPTNDDSLCISYKDKNVKDYANIRDVKFQCRLYHFKSGAKNPQLLPFDTEELFKDHFEKHYKDKQTIVSKTENYYLVDYQDGTIKYTYDSLKEVRDNKEETGYFLMKRVDFFLHRPSPLWTLRFAKIEAWFPHLDNVRTECVVYHAPDVQGYINKCISYKFHGFPSRCEVNELITSKNSLTLENIRLKESEAKAQEELKKLNARVSKGMEFDVNDPIDKAGQFFYGKFDEGDALIERIQIKHGVDVKDIVKKIRMCSYHPNILTFLDWKSDKEYVYLAYERCGRTFHDYIFYEKTPKYAEMSELSTKIIRGLVCGISHLHTRRLVHTKLSLKNIWITDDGTIKIGSVGTSKPKSDIARRADLYQVGEAILLYMCKGNRKRLPNNSLLMRNEFDKLKIPGTNEELWDLLKKLHFAHSNEQIRTLSPTRLSKHIAFWRASKRLGYIRDLSNYLDEGVPSPTDLRKDVNKLIVVRGGNSFSDWRSMFNGDIIAAMEKLPVHSVKPEKEAQSSKSGKEKASNSKEAEQNTTVKYNYSSPVSLTRFMRNGFTHIESLKKRETSQGRTLADELGENVSQLEATFRSASPALLVSLYPVVEKYIDEIPDQLKEYYPE